jgi:hypothetical protein
MQHRRLTTFLVALLALVAVLAFAAGCGDDKEPAVPTDLTAEEIVAQGERAMQDVTSASFAADLSIALEGDAEKVTDPMTRQLLESPLSLNASGASSDDPVAADLSMSFVFMGQPIALEMRAKDGEAWLGYQEQWYKVPADQSKQATGQLSEGALPTDQLKEAGLDPNDWDLTWELVGTEEVGEAEAYHVRGTADAGKFAQSLMDALNDPKLAEQLGGDLAGQLEGATAESQRDLEGLKEALENVSVDVWYEVETLYLRKIDARAAFDMSDQKDAEGLTSMSLTMLVELDGFNEPVEVEEPDGAQPLEKLLEQMFGGFGFDALDGATF